MLKVPDSRLVQWMDGVRGKDVRPNAEEQEEIAYQFPNWHEEILTFLMTELCMKATQIALALKAGHRHHVLNLIRTQMGKETVEILEEVAA